MVRLAKYNVLFDYYGGLLTSRQRQFFELHFQYDLSLGEIAENVGVSRQAVHDLLKRTLAQLDQYEERLGLVARDQKLNQLLDQLEAGLKQELPRRQLLALITAARMC